MRFASAVVAIVLVVAACDASAPDVPTTGPSAASPVVDASRTPIATAPLPSSANAPTFAQVPCPDAVTRVMVMVPTCGYLTVPERRTATDPASIKVFVVRVDPPDGVLASDPMVVVGETMGNRIEYGGLVALAQRTGRVTYLVDRRGTGESVPNLACPQIPTAVPDAVKVPTSDPGATAPIVAAVRACRARLTADGVDVAAYGLDESARDIEDLRLALGSEPWNVIGFGTASRLALEVGRIAPAGVRSIVLDSPVLPQGPDPVFNADAARSAVKALGRRCATEPACHARYDDVAGTLDRAVSASNATPARITVAGSDGPAEVVVDGTRFGRAIRAMFAENAGQSVQAVLPSASAAIDGTLTADDPVVIRAAGDDGLCLGYIPECGRIVHGSLLTTLCRDVVPFVDRAGSIAAGATVPGMAGVFAADGFFDACDAWDVPAADVGEAAPVAVGVPVLALTGEFDPFTGPVSAVEDGASGLEKAIFLEVQNQSYNVFGYDECPRQVRRAWLEDPTAVPDTSCFGAMPVVRAYAQP